VGITLPPSALESCSTAQNPWQVFESAMNKTSLVMGFGFFVVTP